MSFTISQKYVKKTKTKAAKCTEGKLSVTVSGFSKYSYSQGHDCVSYINIFNMGLSGRTMKLNLL